MSVVMDEEIKRWTVRRKAALVLEIIQGKTTVAEASRQLDLTRSEIDSWLEDGKRGDVRPILSSTRIWSSIPPEKEIGREEALFRRADHWVSA